MFCFTNSDSVMSFREFAFCSFINYAYICTWMLASHANVGEGGKIAWRTPKNVCVGGYVDAGQDLKETVPWGTITWSEMANKTYKLKRSITVANRKKGRHPIRQSDQNMCNRLAPRAGKCARVSNKSDKQPTFDILTWLQGFLVIFLYLVWFSLCSSLFWELRDNGVVKNLQFWP